MDQVHLINRVGLKPVSTVYAACMIAKPCHCKSTVKQERYEGKKMGEECNCCLPTRSIVLHYAFRYFHGVDDFMVMQITTVIIIIIKQYSK